MIKGIGGSLKEKSFKMSGTVSAGTNVAVFLRKSDLQAKCSDEH